MGNYQRNSKTAAAKSTDQKREFVNGIFVTKREGQYGEFFSLGLKKSEVLSAIEALDEDDRGFVNLTMTPQKSDPNKYSVYVNSWKPGANESPKQPAAKTGNKVKPGFVDDGNDLPF